MTRSDGASAEFEALYERLYPSLLRYVDRLVGDRDVAEDLAQEVCIRLLRRPDLGGDDARLWSFTVATNLVRDRGRTVSRRQRLLSAVPFAPAELPNPERQLERSEEITTVRAALDRLPERERQMLLMREEGFRYSEIAQVVGVAPGSVGTLIARALKRFVEVYPSDD